MKTSKLTKVEIKILAFIFIFLLAITSWWKVRLWHEGGYGDNAFVVQLSHNIAVTGKPTSELMASIDIVLKSIVTAPAEIQCAMPLTSPADKNFNYFKKWHTYLILYVLAPINLVLSSEITLSFLTILSFLSLLLMAYVAARRRGLPIEFSAMIILIIATHPAWSQSIQGQLYIDRFFLGLAFLLIYLLNDFSKSRKLILLVTVLTTLISDRTGLIAGAILIAHEIFEKLRGSKISRFNLTLGFASCLFSVYLMKFVVEHPAYGGFASAFTPHSIMQNLSNPVFATNLIYFAIISLIIFGSIAVFSPRYFLLAIFLMLPNLFGDIGGAEKIGFSTHYHTLYLPALAWATMEGFTAIYYKFQGRKNSNIFNKILLCFSVAVVIILAGATSLGGIPYLFTKDAFLDEAPIIIAKDIFSYKYGPKKYARERFKSMKKIMPKHSKIATTEPYMTHFVIDYDLTLFPIGLADADYILLPYVKEPNGEYTYFGAATYLGPEESKKINACLKERLKLINFNVDSPLIFEDLALLQKTAAAR